MWCACYFSIPPSYFYGNNLLQKIAWMEVMINKFPDCQYFDEMKNCSANTECLLHVTGNYSKLMKPYSSSRINLKGLFGFRDCAYNISEASRRNNVVYFRVEQHSCVSESHVVSGSNKPSLMGGSNFDIFCRSNETISGCSFIDHFNSSYTVQCPYCGELSKSEMETQPRSVIRYVSIVLTSEYFDALSDAINPWLLDTLLDDVPMEFNIYDDGMRSSSSGNKISEGSNLKLSYSNPITWYSVKWSIRNQSISHEITNMLRATPNLVRNLYSCNSSWTIEKRIFLPERDSYRECLNLSVNSTGTHMYHNTSLCDRVRVSELSTVPKLESIDGSNDGKIINIKKRKYESSQTYANMAKSNFLYHFIGESHIKYLFNYYVYRIYAIKLHYSVSGSHTDKEYRNLYFHWTNYSFTQIHALKQLCSNQNEFRAKKFTVIFQTGHWDLSGKISSLRFLIASDGLGLQLIDFIKSILSGRTVCKGLQHFIWLTTLPYPFCAHNFYCKENRGRRTTDNIRALNSFYTSQLLNINMSPSIRLSIVDAFNIVYPRIFLAEEKEVVAVNHYLAGGSFGAGSFGVRATFAGFAIADAVREALSDHG